jgi:hypothetical protein
MRQIKKKNRRDQFSPKVHNTFMNSHNLKKKICNSSQKLKHIKAQLSPKEFHFNSQIDFPNIFLFSKKTNLYYFSTNSIF